MPFRDHYQTLRIEPDATPGEVSRAIKDIQRQTRGFNLDKLKKDGKSEVLYRRTLATNMYNDFQDIMRAKLTLLDGAKRAKFDKKRSVRMKTLEYVDDDYESVTRGMGAIHTRQEF